MIFMLKYLRGSVFIFVDYCEIYKKVDWWMDKWMDKWGNDFGEMYMVEFKKWVCECCKIILFLL